MVWLAFSGLVLCYVGLVLVNMLVWALEADTVEYGEWKTGVRAEGIIYALFSFTRKTGQAVGGALAAYALAIGGYVAGVETQSVEAEWGIRAAAGLLPAVAAGLAVLIMFFYPLTDKRHREIVAEIEERRRSQPRRRAGPLDRGVRRRPPRDRPRRAHDRRVAVDRSHRQPRHRLPTTTRKSPDP